MKSVTSAADRFRRETSGASLLEGLLVLPIVVFTVFAVIDMGLYMWQWNQAAKATQRGARIAVVTPPATDAIIQSNWVVAEVGRECRDEATGLPTADPATGTALCTNFGTVECRSTGCTSGTLQASFNTISDEVTNLLPTATAANVVVRYEYSGLGFVGRPGGNPVIVTVYLECATTDLIVLDFLAGMTLPAGCPDTGSAPIPPFPTIMISESFGSTT